MKERWLYHIVITRPSLVYCFHIFRIRFKILNLFLVFSYVIRIICHKHTKVRIKINLYPKVNVIHRGVSVWIFFFFSTLSTLFFVSTFFIEICSGFSLWYKLSHCSGAEREDQFICTSSLHISNLYRQYMMVFKINSLSTKFD